MRSMKRFFVTVTLLTFALMLNACTPGDGEISSGPSGFYTGNLPLSVSYASGSFSFAFDNDGNLLFIAETAGELRSLNRTTGEVTVIATGLPTENTRGIAVTDDYIYVGSYDGNIYRVIPSTGAVSLLTSIGAGRFINCMVIAPDTFGSYGGQLIIASGSGIFALDLSTLATTTISTFAEVSSIVFGSDGTLYATDHDNDSVVTVTAAGTATTLATSSSILDGPDGITIDDTDTYLYVTCDYTDTIVRVTISDGTLTTIGTGYDFANGWAPSPIIYDSAGNLLLVGYGALTIDYLSL